MRKYQQLLLVLLSIISILVLLMYKSENNRLRYVLKYVNFFGRQDVAVLQRLENGTKEHAPALAKPLPVWQLIGDSFHAYAVYWNRNELVAGGEAHALVVGKNGAVVDFRCTLIYNDIGTRTVQGKFRFQRAANENLVDDSSTPFTSYNFFCQVSRDFGQPLYVSFMDATSPVKAQIKLRLRHLKPNNMLNSKATQPTEKLQMPAMLPATICVDLVNYNMSATLAQTQEHLLQFFLFHQALGVQHFLVYNHDQLSEQIINVLERLKVQIYALPFNFPFLQTKSSLIRVRQLIETDCLLRNVNYAKFTMLLAPNEIFYPSARFITTVSDQKQYSLYQQLRQYSTDLFRFELATFAVCFDEHKKFLVDNVNYDPEQKPSFKMLLYRLEVPATNLLAQSANAITLPVSTGFLHRYVDCQHVGVDGLHDWRNGMREEFMQHIGALREEVKLLI